LDEEYASVKNRAYQILEKYSGYPNLLTFNDKDRSVTFFTEKLIPKTFTNRPRALLLFSNPHPHSIYQGMFLSPNIRGRENPFWATMNDAGWLLPIDEGYHSPKQLAEICLNVNYQGPFDLIFYCYYAFPTDFPKDISRIFGKEFFKKTIEPEAIDEFRKVVQETNVDVVITFNKGIFNLVSNNQIKKYIERLIEGELIQNEISGFDGNVPIFLTFPTGWHFHKQSSFFRKTSLEKIKTAICG
jgi:hypothetical protein